MTEAATPSVMAFLAISAMAFALARLYPSRSIRGRDFVRRSLYSNSSLTLAVRNLPALAPIWVGMLLAYSTAVLVPRPTALWLVLVAFLLGTAAFILSYRVPAPLLPAWLREEVEAGRTLVATPTTSDWLLFWIVVPLAVLAIVSVPLLIFVFQGS
jgi:hypothetical protein